MEKIPQEVKNLLQNPEQLCFTGLFLSEEEQQKLFETFPPAFKNIDADHITLGYFGNNPNPPATETLSVGEQFEAKVLGHVIDHERQVQTIIVEIPEVEMPEGKKVLHITISTGTNLDGSRVPPFLSNAAIEEAIENGTVLPVRGDTALQIVSGFCLGDYDNGKGTIVTSAPQQVA